MQYKIELATEKDLEAIEKIIIERCKWFIENKIKQWALDYYPKKYNTKYFTEQLKINKLYVAKIIDTDEIVGVMLLKTSDKFWEDDNKALYIHHLATSIKIKGLGSLLLEYATIETSKMNKEFLRLDCFSSNKRLNDYYKSKGFILKGNGRIGDYSYNLWEKKIEK